MPAATLTARERSQLFAASEPSRPLGRRDAQAKCEEPRLIILDGRERLDRAGTNRVRILGRSVPNSDGDRVRIPRGLE